jgi:hypothetical protein
MSGHPKIFVSIASFCDAMLTFTVKSALETARYPERLSFGIVDQNHVSVEDALPRGDWRIAYLSINPHQSRGACWARSLAMSLYAGEDYFFQVDSHSLFEQDWDVMMIEALEAISGRTGNRKIILSTRPFAFEIDAAGTVEKKRFTTSTIKLVPKEPSAVIKLGEPVVMFAAYNANTPDDLPGFQVSAAQLFTRGGFVEEIPYDPYLYFHGEEQNISMRAFTHGWDIWHPNVVPLYHLYKTRAQGEAPLHWDQEFEAKRQEKWLEFRNRAWQRLADLITGKLTGAYGLGNTRSIEDYLNVSGLRVEGASLNTQSMISAPM